MNSLVRECFVRSARRSSIKSYGAGTYEKDNIGAVPLEGEKRRGDNIRC